MNIRQMLVAQSKYSIKCPYLMTPEYITVHNTANDASANNEISYMINNNNQVSYHFAVDDIEAVQGIKLDRNGWHAGDGNGTGNRKTIGVEICYSKSGGARFDKAEDNAAQLISQMLKDRGWGIDRVKKHQDWSGKYCPHRTLDYGWGRFLNKINLTEEEMTTVNDIKTLYLVLLGRAASDAEAAGWAGQSWTACYYGIKDSVEGKARAKSIADTFAAVQELSARPTKAELEAVVIQLQKAQELADQYKKAAEEVTPATEEQNKLWKAWESFVNFIKSILPK